MDDLERKGKVGIGVITCNRPHFFRDCMIGLPEADLVVIVNDGDSYASSMYPSRVAKVMQHRRNKGIGRSKNEALRYLLNAGCSHIFLCEDDMRIENPELCRQYVRASTHSGILHFNFAYHGPKNKHPDGSLVLPRKTIEYGSGVAVSLHRNLGGAFQYFRRNVLQECGLFDPVYKNMIEHIDHTYRIIRTGYHPPFWWFADLAESFRSIRDLDPEHAKSTSQRDGWSYRFFFRLYCRYFSLKHGYRLEQVPDAAEADVVRMLSELKHKYARRAAE